MWSVVDLVGVKLCRRHRSIQTVKIPADIRAVIMQVIFVAKRADGTMRRLELTDMWRRMLGSML